MHSRTREPVCGEVTAVGLGAVEVGLQHGARLREVGAQLAQDAQRGVGGGVVLHVEGHGGARRGGGLADLARVVEGDLPAVAGQRLAHRGELDADLGPAGEARVVQQAEQRDVRVARGLRLAEVLHVLAEVVDGDQPAGRR